MTAMPAPAITSLDDAIVRHADQTLEIVGRAREAVQSVIFGQENVVDLSLLTILAGGHGLLVGVPGLAKTKLVETLGTVLGLEARRVQFTPDLMPSDILGTEVLDEGADRRRSFRFVKGPIFAQLLMADEINRASPRTQSALLQAMQEHHVSVAGERHDLPQPFHVLATQNPIEQEGTYPLPEAQLDRFLLEVEITYPDEAAERAMLLATTGARDDRPVQALTGAELIAAQALIRRIPVGEGVLDAILRLVRGARPEHSADPMIRKQLAWGPGPRAAQALMLATRARAVLDGRLAPSVEDVLALAQPVLRHRMALNFSARAEGVQVADVIETLKAQLG
jgi:MoxR-like ATPase